MGSPVNPNGWRNVQRNNGRNSVSAGRARDHLHWLAEHDTGLVAVALESGVARSTLKDILYGHCSACHTTRRITMKTESAILAVRPAHGQPTERVPIGPTLQHVDELRAHGWTNAQIARACGQQDHHLRFGRRQTVTRGVADTIRRLADSLTPTTQQHRSRQPKPPDEPPDIRAIPPDLDLDWLDRAACKHLDDMTALERNRMFFPSRGDNAALKAAKAVCAHCPVRDECLTLGMVIDAPGVWGGLSELERHKKQGRRVAHQP